MESEPIVGLATITRMAFLGVDLTPFGATLIGQIERNPQDAKALMELSRVLLAKDLEASLAAQAMALSLRQLYHVDGGPARLRLLALMAPGDQTANTPVEFLLDGGDVALDLLYVAAGLPFPTSVPEHDILFVGVGESDESRPMLEWLAPLLSSWPRPVVNRPERILSMSREAACALLASAPGIEMPLAARIDRSELARIGAGERPITDILGDGRFPIIVRPVGSHMGRGLARVDAPAGIADYLGATNYNEFCISRYVDYAGPDGRFRKYRVVLVEGRPFASHLAIGESWIVHYQKAKMEQSAAKRAEEERFMVRFDADFARRHEAALGAIYQRTGLDYVGVDCGETKDGRLLIFEVDNAMLVHAMDPVDLFPYKQQPMRKLFDAFRAMLAAAAARRRTDTVGQSVAAVGDDVATIE